MKPSKEAPGVYAIYRDSIAGLPLPRALLDVDLLDKNIAAVAGRVHSGKTIRVASKSIRCVWALRRILESGLPYRGIMAYAAEEAEFLLQEGFDDILLGYPIYRRGGIEILCDALASGKSVTFMVDAPEHIARIDAVAKERGVTAPVCVDIDMSTPFPGLHFGVRRSPLRGTGDLEPFIEAARGARHIRLRGVMGYEAQIAGLPEKNPANGLLKYAIPFLKRRSMRDFRARRATAVKTLRDAGFDIDLVNGGGTGSIESTAEEEVVTEITAGSGFFAPGLFDHYTGFQHAPALFYAIEIVRRPKPGLYTCAGGGYPASGSASSDKLPVPYLPAAARLIKQEGAGEVQTPIEFEGPEELALGDPVFMRHAKAGELCERFMTISLLHGGKLTGEVPTYRGQGHCFL